MLKPLANLLAICIGLAAGAVSQAVAQEGEGQQQPQSSALSDQASLIQGNEPVDISADSANVDETTRILLLTGNVVARQGPVELTADTVRVHYIGGASMSSSLDGTIKLLEAEGHVVLKRPGEVVTSNAATYLMRERRIVMKGAVTANRGQNVIRGEQVVIDLARETIELKSDNGKDRVKAIFTPPESGNPP